MHAYFVVVSTWQSEEPTIQLQEIKLLNMAPP